MSYILTGVVDYESEDLILLTDDIEEAKAAAATRLQGARFGPDCYIIYEAELGGTPEPILESLVDRSWNLTQQRTVCTLKGWT